MFVRTWMASDPVSDYLLSDLHLERGNPALLDIFLRFLRGPARQANAVYLLGDIFEVWVGDDDPAPLPAKVAAEIRALTDTGVRVYFMHGNRDFLVGQAYADRAGMQLLEDPHVAALGGRRTILSHGDRYSLDDHVYQAFRKKSRTPQWQNKVLSWPLWRRRLVAKAGRVISRYNYLKKVRKTGNPLQIADITPAAITSEFARLDTTRMIHGHTHRPDVHLYQVGQSCCERIVLSDWREFGEAMEVRQDGSYVRHVLR